MQGPIENHKKKFLTAFNRVSLSSDYHYNCYIIDAMQNYINCKKYISFSSQQTDCCILMLCKTISVLATNSLNQYALLAKILN